MNKDVQRLMIWLGLAVALIAGILVIIFMNKPASNTSSDQPKNLTLTNSEWDRGNPDSQVVLVEYSDFQCPACASREPQVKDIIKEFGSHVRFVYRQFPLRNNHANAQIAGQAAEAAGMQNKFWEMHDMLFDKQQEWAGESDADAKQAFIGYAATLGLDTAKFTQDLTSKDAENAVNADYNSGLALGVNSTPTFFLNGKEINPTNYEEFRQLIKSAIDEQQNPAT